MKLHQGLLILLFIFYHFGALAQEGGSVSTGDIDNNKTQTVTLKTLRAIGNNPQGITNEMFGGLHAVQSIGHLHTIGDHLLQIGMLVWVDDIMQYYRYQGDVNNTAYLNGIIEYAPYAFGVNTNYWLNQCISQNTGTPLFEFSHLLIMEGDIATEGLQLSTKSASNVTVNLASSDAAKVSLDETSFVFTESDWNTSKGVALNAIEDADVYLENITVITGAYTDEGDRFCNQRCKDIKGLREKSKTSPQAFKVFMSTAQKNSKNKLSELRSTDCKKQK